MSKISAPSAQKDLRTQGGKFTGVDGSRKLTVSLDPPVS